MSNSPVNFIDLFTSFKGLPWQIEAMRQLESKIPPSLLHKDNEWYKTWENSEKLNPPEWYSIVEEFTKDWEDCRLVAYLCKGKVWTVGWGSTFINGRPVRQGDTVTQSQADEMHRSDLLNASEHLFRLIPGSKNWKSTQIAALVSFTYNLGPTNLEQSTLRKRILAGEDLTKVVSEELPRWNKADGKESEGLIKRRSEEVELFTGGPLKPAPTPPERTQWVTKIKALNLSQPDSSTCQAACIGMAIGDSNVLNIRRKLLAKGNAGNPAVMASVIREYERPYVYDGDASLSDVYEWLKAGEFLITHGWFTGSGHVICLDGLRKNSDGSYSLDVKDPWSEFNAPAWKYDKSSKFYDGFYSDLCIYAACVAGTSVSSSRSIYQSGKVNANQGGMWVHRFKTSPIETGAR